LDKLPPSTEYDIAHFEISRNNISHREKPMNNYYNIYQTDDTLAEQNTYEIKSFKIGAFGYVITKRGAINILKKYGYTIAGAPDDFLNIFLNHGGVFIEPSELLIEAREDIPSAIWGDGANSKCIESRKFNRIVIFGGTGMLGRYMVKYFSDKYAVIEINRSTFDIGKISVDEIIKYLNTVICEGDLVLNCAGVINKRADITESEMIKVNSIFPYLLSQVVSEKMAWMVQPTTDCVFSGNKGLYNYSDVKDAKDIYGITKSIGEVNGNRCSVIRCSIIGEEVGNSRSLVEWAKSQRGSKVKGYTNHKWNGITCLQYAKEIDNMIGKGFPKNLIFTSFWVDNEGQKRDCISKYDLLLLLNKIYNLDLEIECHETDISIDRTLSGTEVCVSLNDQIQEMRTFCLI
jgi:dTDP-4-dehydrorhamnose reductase